MSPLARQTVLSLLSFALASLISSFAWAGIVDDALSDYEDVRQGVVAGVRSVGNGGGYAEMQAEFINLRLHTWIKNAPPVITIEIEPRCGASPIHVLSAKAVRLSSCALYRIATSTSSTQPKPFNEIATWILTARLMAQGSSFKDAYPFASLQFVGFSQNEQSLEISLTSGNFLFHDLTVTVKSSAAAVPSSKVLSLEGRMKTHDVTSLASNQLRCGSDGATDWSTRDAYARATGRTGALVSSAIAWTCADGSRWEGQLLTSFDSDSGEVKPSSIILRVVQKRQVAK